MSQHRRGNNAGAGNVSADMADTSNQKMADLAADHQTDVVGGNNRADQRAGHVNRR
ncbi:hypothetical protein D3C76_1694450 [compost metagenome]